MDLDMVPVSIACGDGIGPEIMEATLAILSAAGAAIAPENIAIGQATYEAGHLSGIAPEAWESLRRTHVLLKGPMTTPQGKGYKSVNVTLRKSLGLYANVRPNVAYAPFVTTRHPKMDLVIIRENEEDLYAGIEHRQTDDVMQCLKLITAPGSERIIRYAFEYARRNNRRRVSCMTKDNIMKLTDGLFHRIFTEISAEYPDLETDHLIVDIGAARLADTPERFDVVVTTNLYGDILSDIAAQLAGSVGIAPSANIGGHCSLFEAIHGSAPDIAGRGRANPSGLLLAAVMMLTHIRQPEVAERVHNAWLRTLEDGIHTDDIASEGYTRQCVGTADFTQAVIRRLGEEPQRLRPVRYQSTDPEAVSFTGATGTAAPPPRTADKVMIGVDVFLHCRGGTPEELAGKLKALNSESMLLEMITNRGVRVWPGGLPETFCTDHWRCRFKARPEVGSIRHSDIVSLLTRVTDAGLDFIKCENLCLFDGEPGFAMGHGQ